MADHQTPENSTDPVTRIAKMAQEGDVSKITTKMLEEALEYSRGKDRERESLTEDDKSAS